MTSKAAVSIVKVSNPYRLVKEALELIDIEKRIKKDSKVFIKPNLVKVPAESPYANMKGAYETTFTEGDIVHRETLEALLKVLHELGVYNIAFGDAPGGSDSELVYKALELYELAEEFGAKLIDLNSADSVRLPVENGLILKHVWVPKVLIESDFRISLAAMKIIPATCVSLCLKNWGMGVPPGKYYGANKASNQYYRGLEGPLPIHKAGSKKIYGQEVDVARLIVDVCATLGYELGIIDGLTVQHYVVPSTSYSSPQKAERKDIVIASYDMVASDAIGTRILGFDPKKIIHIKWATERGLGVAKLSDIDIRGRRIEEVEMRCNAMISHKELTLPT